MLIRLLIGLDCVSIFENISELPITFKKWYLCIGYLLWWCSVLVFSLLKGILVNMLKGDTIFMKTCIIIAVIIIAVIMIAVTFVLCIILCKTSSDDFDKYYDENIDEDSLNTLLTDSMHDSFWK